MANPNPSGPFGAKVIKNKNKSEKPSIESTSSKSSTPTSSKSSGAILGGINQNMAVHQVVLLLFLHLV